MVSQRWVFRLCASKLASDESLSHQHMGVVYHQGRSQIASTSESHGGDLIIQRRDFCGVINRLLSWRESIGRKRDRGGEKCRGKLQVPGQGERTKAKKLHKTDVDGLLIKIAESKGLRVDAGVLYQGMK
ncbi:hypothetical protein GW17_00055933 [Ensete ventricosum]|nr:hypothetical protein GW17_00055933 [Ensete ventricosum]